MATEGPCRLPWGLWEGMPGALALTPGARGLGEVYFTVGGELVPVEHGETQHVLVQVLDEELAVEVPLGVQGVGEGPGGVALGAHADFTVRVALS